MTKALFLSTAKILTATAMLAVLGGSVFAAAPATYLVADTGPATTVPPSATPDGHPWID
ncbi:hypothetical protein ACFWY9_28215 [Amycolatopsis sp. NPDC059027]|uniref:hypothetical protein n=1 Tax=unclassified Amycolatopsis TaxID=2618356 RepID=UPI00366EA4FE